MTECMIRTVVHCTGCHKALRATVVFLSILSRGVVCDCCWGRGSGGVGAEGFCIEGCCSESSYDESRDGFIFMGIYARNIRGSCMGHYSR